MTTQEDDTLLAMAVYFILQ